MRADVVIVGGGVIGCACAGFLSRAGKKVVLLERASIASGTTSNSFSWANASSKINNIAYHQLNALGVEMYRSLANAFGNAPVGFNPVGSVFLSKNSDEVGMADLANRQKVLTDFGYPAEFLSAKELKATEPAIPVTNEMTGLLAPKDAIIDGPKFSRFMLGFLKEYGGLAKEHCGDLSLIADDDGVIKGVETSSGPLYAPAVIVATGQHTGETLSQLTGYDGFDARFPLRKAPGLLLTTPPVHSDFQPRHVVEIPQSQELHFLPEFGGSIKIGSDDMDGLIAEDRSEANLRHVGQMLLDRAKNWMPHIERVDIGDCRLAVGVRPFPSDGVSILGQVPHSNGLYVLATHSGISLAPVIGSYMADILSGKPPAFDPDPYSLERFPGFE